MKIRRASPSDAAAIAVVHSRCWQIAYEHVFGAERLANVERPERVDRWRATLREQTQTTLVAEDGDAIVGFCTVGGDRAGSGNAEVWGLYVIPAAWGSVIAAALMSAGLAELRSIGYSEALLWVLADNAAFAAGRAACSGN